ncbi:MAG: DUF3240 domain-containing protein [Candidatus Methylumidiphilus alinenensis]|uniref:DUF3240 domain-containing protein n=1 Tax=Candidatus Methylumidiphilus alinenensis TaxID=2202197 RepID=A0A2W4QU43_9GAMM|nr:MAG: DUF3240 domain-containing protein [Candidatus Methylumidiphilus alinenensis]
MNPQVLITLTVPPSIEESIVDWLLQFNDHSGFTSQWANGHSSQMEGLNLAEQVAGRKQQIRFQMHINTDDLPRFMDTLKRDFADAGLHYWVTPVIDVGHI